MTTKLFSIFTGVAMAIIIGITAFLRKLSKSYSSASKKPLVVAVLISIIDAVLAFCITYTQDDDFFLSFWVLCALYLILGIVNLSFVNKFFVQFPDENMQNIRLGQVLFTLGIMLLTTILHFIGIFFLGSNDFLYYPLLLSIIAFSIPLAFGFTYNAVEKIPLPIYPLWQYPDQIIAPPEDNYNERLLVIAFFITKKRDDIKNTLFRAKAPEGIRLGDLYYHFINDYNELQSETPITFLDENGNAIVWWFRLKRKWYLTDKILDPNISVRENNIKENAVIICEHVKS